MKLILRDSFSSANTREILKLSMIDRTALRWNAKREEQVCQNRSPELKTMQCGTPTKSFMS